MTRRKPGALDEVTKRVTYGMRDLVSATTDRFYERTEAAEGVALCLLSKQHGYLLGPKGTGKTEMLDFMCQGIAGANFFQILMDRQLGKEEVFGERDWEKFIEAKVWERDVNGFLPSAHIALIDEPGKAGPASFNPMLWLLANRKYRNGKQVLTAPLISAFGGANELLEPELAAIFDRFTWRYEVDYIEEAVHFESMLLDDGREGHPGTLLTLEDLLVVINEVVPAVQIPAQIMEKILQIRSDLRGASIKPSDRRWKAGLRMVKASSLLNNRTEPDEDDITVYEHILWDDVSERSKVREIVSAMAGEITRFVTEKEVEVADVEAKIVAVHGRDVDTRADVAHEANVKLGEIKNGINRYLTQAKSEGRSTAKLDHLKEFWNAVKTQVLVVGLGVPADRARLKILDEWAA